MPDGLAATLGQTIRTDTKESRDAVLRRMVRWLWRSSLSGEVSQELISQVNDQLVFEFAGACTRLVPPLRDTVLMNELVKGRTRRWVHPPLLEGLGRQSAQKLVHVLVPHTAAHPDPCERSFHSVGTDVIREFTQSSVDP